VKGNLGCEFAEHGCDCDRPPKMLRDGDCGMDR